MSERERAIGIIREAPDQTVTYSLEALEDMLDDLYCRQLYDEAAAEDDGYRVTMAQLLDKYGIAERELQR